MQTQGFKHDILENPMVSEALIKTLVLRLLHKTRVFTGFYENPRVFTQLVT